MRTVLITGASRGIVRAIATLLLSQGHHLCLAVRDPDRSSIDPLRRNPQKHSLVVW